MITARIVQGDDYDQFMLCIPQEAADIVGWTDGDFISVEVVDGKLVLENVTPSEPTPEYYCTCEPGKIDPNCPFASDKEMAK